MRTPTPRAVVWAWYEAALAGERVEHNANTPQAGFFKVRKFRYGEWPKGPWIPARVWWEPGEIDEATGELLTDEQCRAEINGRSADAWKVWTWISRHPISENEWSWLRAMAPLTPNKIPEKLGRA